MLLMIKISKKLRINFVAIGILILPKKGSLILGASWDILVVLDAVWLIDLLVR